MPFQELQTVRARSINGLLRGPEGYATLIELVDDVLEVPDGTGQPVDAGHYFA